MKDRVFSANPNRGKFSVETEPDTFTVFELINSTHGIEIGDEIDGPLDSLGRQKIKNITRSGWLDVCVIDINLTKLKARKLLK